MLHKAIDVYEASYDVRTLVSVKRHVKSELTGERARAMTTALQPRSYASNFRPAVRSFLSYTVVKLVLGAPPVFPDRRRNYTTARASDVTIVTSLSENPGRRQNRETRTRTIRRKCVLEATD